MRFLIFFILFLPAITMFIIVKFATSSIAVLPGILIAPCGILTSYKHNKPATELKRGRKGDVEVSCENSLIRKIARFYKLQNWTGKLTGDVGGQEGGSGIWHHQEISANRRSMQERERKEGREGKMKTTPSKFDPGTDTGADIP